MSRAEINSLLGQMVQKGELVKEDNVFVTVYRLPTRN